MAAVWKLPVVFVCQNNRYGEHTPLRMTTAVDADQPSARRPTAWPRSRVDGNDPVAMWHARRRPPWTGLGPGRGRR